MARFRCYAARAALILVVIPLYGCPRQPEVRTASTLVVRHATNLRQQVSLYADGINKNREASEERLAGVRRASQAQAAKVDGKLTQWRLAKKKLALKLMRQLRADDVAIAKDPFVAAGFGPAPGQGPSETFGRVKADTEAFDTLIKNISKLQEPRSAKELFTFALEIAKRVKDEIKALEKAKKEQGDASAQ